MPKEFIQSINTLEPNATLEDMQKIFDGFTAFCEQTATTEIVA